MTKNLKLSFILYLAFFAVVIAFNALMAFFSGAGVAFVGLVGLVTTMLILIFVDKHVFNRTKDLFVLICILTIFEFLVYFVLDFRIGNENTWRVFLGMQNVLSFIALLCFAYTVFRLLMEIKEIKIGFVEFILGNPTREVKPKKAKELTNGCLEDKPNNHFTPSTEDDSEDESVVIEEDED